MQYWHTSTKKTRKPNSGYKPKTTTKLQRGGSVAQYRNNGTDVGKWTNAMFSIYQQNL